MAIRTKPPRARILCLNVLPKWLPSMKPVKDNAKVTTLITTAGRRIERLKMEKLNPTTKAKRMGFGLVICKRIVEAHGGTIIASSMLGKGATFKVTLPLCVKTGSDAASTAPEALTLNALNA